jgi:DHA3 family tetracycline resistance protein-like MFS transporter
LALFGDNAILRLLVIFGFLAAFAEEGIDQFWQVHLHEIVAVPVGWFGVLVAVPPIIVFVFASRVIVGVRRRLAPGRAIAVLQLFYSIGVVGFALLAGLWSPVMLIGIFVLAELKRPILAAWTNEQIESTNRAGMLSVMNLVSSSGEVCAGLVFGYTTGLISLPLLFVTAAVFSLAAAGVIGRYRTATTGDS